MDFLQSLLPTEWILRLFKPDEDTEPGASIYLHIKDDDVTFRFRNDVSRYDVVEFIKEIHDDNLLDGEHNDINKLSHINFVCNCGNKSHKTFINISNGNGAHCTNCTKTIKQKNKFNIYLLVMLV